MRFWRAILLYLTAAFSAGANEFAEVPAPAGPLSTRWAAEVGPTNALPEYPRPQLVRTEWRNLNGLWDYAITPISVTNAPAFQGKILVPFPVESLLSQVKTNIDEQSKLWYQHTFAVPNSWRDRRVRLHFGAVDWRCQVAVNGHVIGRHQGGYDPFVFDITDALRWNGKEEMAICVTDPTEGDQPRGKQSRKPDGIFYTSTSGIWQTVWIEPVPATCIDRLIINPDVDSKSVRVRVAVNTFSEGLRARVAAWADGKEMAAVSGPANGDLQLNLPDPHLWSPDDPFLYDLKVTLENGSGIFDTVSSYFGMRKVALEKDSQGFTRIALNGRFTFEVGILDQGFWPDGIYTAPTDAALRSDIEFLKKCGFNLARKHVKVEPDRWYYWCDKLGLLVWQDMPSGNNSSGEGQRDFQNELRHVVDSLRNHPCVITWVLFNEGWGQFDTEPLTQWLKQLDPSRLVDNASGWTDMRAGDLIDMHSYPGPESPAPEGLRAAVLGEFGGFGAAVPGHTWSGHCWAYVMLSNKIELTARYSEALKHAWRLHDLRGLSAVVYTQNTDVETECNGLQTYDRAVTKMDPDAISAANSAGIADNPIRIVLADGLSGGVNWRYTIEKPADDWFEPGFHATTWKEGPGGFGNAGTPGIIVNTKWDTGDIWLRREFELKADELTGLKLDLFHDEDVEVYINGVLALKLSGFVTDYDEYDISPEAAASVKPGINAIAVHCHQTIGGQGVDVGVLVRQAGDDSRKKPK